MPEDGPYNVHRGRTSRERAAEEAVPAGVTDLRRQLETAQQNIAALFEKLRTLETWKGNLRGENGVTVNEAIIGFDDPKKNEAGATDLSLVNEGEGVELASLNGSVLTMATVADTTTVTASINGAGELELEVMPLAGEGVFTESLGSGAVEMIIDSGAVLTGTVSVKSLDSEGAILLVESSGTITVHWTYDDAGTGLSLVKEQNAIDGVLFYSINGLGEKGIAVQLVDDMLRFEFKGANAPGGDEEIYLGLDPDEGARFRAFKAGTNVTFAGSTDDVLQINAAGAGSGITQLTGDVLAGPAVGPAVATLASVIVAGTVVLPYNLTYDAKGRILSVAEAPAGPPPGYENLVVQAKLEDGTCVTITILVES